jgi:hypothetical protein
MNFWDELIDAYMDNNEEHEYFLDLENGQLIFESSSYPSDESIDWDSEDALEKYVSIPQITSNEAFKVMEQFARQQTNENFSIQLFDALSKKKPFGRFKDAVNELDFKNDWYAYEKAHAKKEVKEWIELNNIPIDLLIERFMKSQSSMCFDGV